MHKPNLKFSPQNGVHHDGNAVFSSLKAIKILLYVHFTHFWMIFIYVIADGPSMTLRAEGYNLLKTACLLKTSSCCCPSCIAAVASSLYILLVWIKRSYVWECKNKQKAAKRILYSTSANSPLKTGVDTKSSSDSSDCVITEIVILHLSCFPKECTIQCQLRGHDLFCCCSSKKQ